jgi:hypothetical protein
LDGKQPVLYDKSCPRDYLVVYVHFLRRLVKRLQAKGFQPLLDIQLSMDITYSIFLDPNGIEVRLLEVPDVKLNEVTNKVQWYARLGYYVMYSGNGEELKLYWESLFAKQRKMNHSIRGVPLHDSSEKANLSSFLGPTPRNLNQTKKYTDRAHQKEGLRLVDAEELVSGLQQSKFYWFGHAPRDKMCCFCVCTVPTMIGESSAGTSTVVRRSNRLVSIGIELGVTLDYAIAQIMKESPDSFSVTEERIRVAGMLKIVDALAFF